MVVVASIKAPRSLNANDLGGSGFEWVVCRDNDAGFGLS